MSEEPTVTCPACGTTAEFVEGRTYTDPDEVAVDKIVFDGVAEWVEIDDELEYRLFWCPECECQLRQVEWDGETEPPVRDPTQE